MAGRWFRRVNVPANEAARIAPRAPNVCGALPPCKWLTSPTKKNPSRWGRRRDFVVDPRAAVGNATEIKNFLGVRGPMDKSNNNACSQGRGGIPHGRNT